MKIQNERLIHNSECGMVTVVFIGLLAIMMILVTVEGRALFRLHREVKILEQQQIKRLNTAQTSPAGGIKIDPK